MVDSIKTLAQVDEAQKRYLSSVDGTKDVIGDDCQGGFGGITGTEAMLSREEDMIGGEVVIQLTLNDAFNHFADDVNDGKWVVV